MLNKRLSEYPKFRFIAITFARNKKEGRQKPGADKLIWS